ncbi:MAG: T9SS type A sorting domain-containing protein [Bacteroidetes bacterium]|nr:T9SS type A sorting domain-containing protein [Bacteroidota bacterium]
MRASFTHVLPLFLLATLPLFSQTVQDKVVTLTATVDAATPAVTLNWNSTAASDLLLFRREKDSPDWYIFFDQLASTATSFTDTFVVAGQTYEYGIQRLLNGIYAFGYVTVPVEAPVTDARGTMAVLVDTSLEVPLATELERLRHDLIGDGWKVMWHSIPAGSTVAAVKSQIVDDFTTANIRSVLLFGNLPVPYSGNSAWDGHTDHQGAWPADSYYGDVNSSAWTDATVNNITPSRAANDNIPGDGKFDQSYVPTTSEIAVGRVDFSNLTEANFGTTQVELYRRYLNKNHNWRTKQYTVANKVLIDDNFGYFGGEAFAADGYRNGNPLVGPSNVMAGDFFNDTDGEGFLFGYGCGGGTYTSAGGVGTSAQFGSDSVNIVFSMLFGSYHGDWDYSPDPFMPSALASKGGILSCGWAGRPDWFTHHLGGGETIGYCVLATQNSCDNAGYYGNFGECGAHVTLLGDPSLRAQIVAPATDVVASQNCNEIELNWTATAQGNLLGYHVYRANALNGDYTRLTAAPWPSTTFTDGTASGGTLYYQVRAVVLEETPSGRFFNTGTGAFGSLNFAPATPPVADAGPDLALTCSQPSVTTAACNPAYLCTLTGPNGSQSLPATINMPGTYMLTVTDPANGCTATDLLVVSQDITPPANVTATLGNINCLTETALLLGNSTTPGVTYSWTGPGGFVSDLQNPTITESGTYNLTVTNANGGCTSTASINITSGFSSPDATATGGDLTCSVNSVQLTGNSGTPNVTYSWTGPGGFTSNLQNPTVTVPGTYLLEVTAPNGCMATATATVTQSGDLPVADAGPDFLLTCSQTSVTTAPCNPAYNCVLTGPNGSQNLPATINQPGTYTLTVTDPANGCTATDQLVVSQNITPPANVTASLGNINCLTETALLLGNSTTPGVTYSWTGPGGVVSNLQNPTITESGTYILTVTVTGTGCTATASINITSGFSSPDATATGGDLTCSVNSVQLTGNSGTPNVTYSWTGPGGFTSNLQNPTVTVPGTYVLEVTAPNGCTATATAAVTQSGDLPVADPTAAGILTCAVTSVTILANPDQAGYNFAWTGPGGFTSTDQNPSVTEPGTYVLTVTNPATGCAATYTEVVVENTTAPTFSLPDLTLTCTTPILILTPPPFCGLPNFVCLFNGQVVTGPVVIQTGGPYPFTVTETTTGCSASDDFLVIADMAVPDLTVTGDMTLDCFGETTTLTANSTTPGVTYNWQGNGIPNPSNAVQSVGAGTYTVAVVAPNGCSTTQQVQVTSPPQLQVTVVTIMDCDGFSEIDIQITGGTLPYTWQITPPSPVPPNSTFTWVVTDGNGCTVSGTDTTDIVQPIEFGFSITDETVLGADDGSATVMASGGTPPYTYLWSNGQTGPTATNLAPGFYTCSITDANGCEVVVAIEILPGTNATTDLPGLRSLTLSPNPTGGRFELSLALENPLPVQVEVVDVTGRILAKTPLENVLEKSWQFDLTPYPSGVYICKILANGQVAGLRVVRL